MAMHLAMLAAFTLLQAVSNSEHYRHVVNAATFLIEAPILSFQAYEVSTLIWCLNWLFQLVEGRPSSVCLCVCPSYQILPRLQQPLAMAQESIGNKAAAHLECPG